MDPLRAVLASTLGLRTTLYNPFAERGAGPVRLTAVAATAARLWRHLPAIPGGRFDNDMNLAAGYLSGRGWRADLQGIGGYALDGKAFAADPTLPLALSSGIALRMIRP